MTKKLRGSDMRNIDIQGNSFANDVSARTDGSIDQFNSVINVVTRDLNRNHRIDLVETSIDRNMLNLKDQAKSLSLKHGLSEEAMLIEHEEIRLNQLLQD